jgi:hypothetical protein
VNQKWWWGRISPRDLGGAEFGLCRFIITTCVVELQVA